jgi:hypothetical protein
MDLKIAFGAISGISTGLAQDLVSELQTIMSRQLCGEPAEAPSAELVLLHTRLAIFWVLKITTTLITLVMA